jgi:hypothetical protein
MLKCPVSTKTEEKKHELNNCTTAYHEKHSWQHIEYITTSYTQ